VCPGSAEREAVLRAIIRTLPNKEIASQLVDVYASRVYYLTGHIVHIPTLLREMDAFYSFDSVEKQARVLNYVDPAWLSMFLMILVLGLQFYPCYPPEHYINIQNLFDGKTIHLWYSAHKTILILARYQCSQSIAVLQAILLADLHGAEHERTSASLLRIAITNAQEMGLHRLGDKSRQPQPDEAPGTTILREMYKRIWWSLVWRDWGTSMKNGGVYTIHPGQFNTPYPGN
jgi:Fungal specific transcription factor domain